MAKPIFTIGIPGELPPDVLDKIRWKIEKKFHDYHVLVFRAKADESVFQAFYEKDFNEVTFEELKEYVREQMK